MIRPSPRSGRAALVLLGALLFSVTACSGASDEDDVAAAVALVDQGIVQIQQGDATAAEATFERALRLDDAQHAAHYNLGVIDQNANRTSKARAHYEKALDLAPAHGPSLYNLAILTEPDDVEAAVELYRKAVDAQPDHAATYMRLGFALNHLGRTAEAEPMLAKGLDLDPSMKDVEAPSYDD